MAKFFKRKQKEKESHIATTPKQETKEPSLTKKKVFFLILNIMSIVLYSSYTLFVTYQMAEKTFLSKAIIVLLAIYAVAFVILLLLSLGNHKKLKNRMKNYKSAINFFKYAIRIINFVLSIITAISAISNTGKVDFSLIGYAVLSFIITIILILVEIAAIIVRKNIPLIKRNFLEIREPENFNDKKFDEETKDD